MLKPTNTNYLYSDIKNESLANHNNGKMITEQSGWRSNAQIMMEMLASGRALEKFRSEHYHSGYLTKEALIEGPRPKEIYQDKISDEQAFIQWEEYRKKAQEASKSASEASQKQNSEESSKNTSEPPTTASTEQSSTGDSGDK